MPHHNHFVVLDHFEDDYVWLADLSNSKFLDRHEVSRFSGDWSSGVALLLSNQPIVGQFEDIGDNALDAIAGGNGWSCTSIIQQESVDFCWETMGDCGGYFTWHYERWGCEWAPSGSCPDYALAFYSEDECRWNPSQGCYGPGNWYTAYGTACD
jgi:hypothetical protein